jgi:DeoR/GlpR family transcriptional regulator of sugar metabolism
MLPEERKKRILALLAQSEFANVESLSEAVNASPATVRRDLEALAARGAITRTRGGASLGSYGFGHEPPYLTRLNNQLLEKRAIAQAAGTLVHEGEVIALDVGSTAFEIAKALRHRRNLTVFTANLAVAQLLIRSEISVIVVGGSVRKMEMSTAGPLALQAISQFHFDKFFMGAAGVTRADGFTDFGMEDVELKKAFIARSKEMIAVADHTKLGCVSFVTTCPLSAGQRLITDAGADLVQVDALRQAGLEVILANTDGALPDRHA